MSNVRVPEDCNLFDRCSANLCPLDPHMKNKVWCPEESDHEETCHNPEFAGLQFIRTQKKIGRAIKKKDHERDDHFSYEMLNRNIVVKSGIQGVPCDLPDSVKDTEKWYSDKERKWILGHREKKQLSFEEIEKRRSRMKSIRKVPSSIQFPEMASSKGVVARLNIGTFPNPIAKGELEK